MSEENLSIIGQYGPWASSLNEGKTTVTLLQKIGMVKSCNLEGRGQKKTSGPHGYTEHWRHTKSDRKKTVHIRWSAH